MFLDVIASTAAVPTGGLGLSLCGDAPSADACSDPWTSFGIVVVYRCSATVVLGFAEISSALLGWFDFLRVMVLGDDPSLAENLKILEFFPAIVYVVAPGFGVLKTFVLVLNAGAAAEKAVRFIFCAENCMYLSPPAVLKVLITVVCEGRGIVARTATRKKKNSELLMACYSRFGFRTWCYSFSVLSPANHRPSTPAEEHYLALVNQLAPVDAFGHLRTQTVKGSHDPTANVGGLDDYPSSGPPDALLIGLDPESDIDRRCADVVFGAADSQFFCSSGLMLVGQRLILLQHALIMAGLVPGDLCVVSFEVESRYAILIVCRWIWRALLSGMHLVSCFRCEATWSLDVVGVIRQGVVGQVPVSGVLIWSLDICQGAVLWWWKVPCC
ncbi:hypothetical protein Nepgr_033832 [Nepenthes gracilis]|uniref:Uncharacterized protein n=1 Tax=Nepenthes gracilis TaxID=150966 RepID=A0AAD3TMZ6_NEPGR|nr:hypothetical protein Nepgr_033832 [Nepenthes gracilis]